MIIELSAIVPRPKPFEAEFGQAEIGLDMEGVALDEPVNVKGETERVDGRSHIRGNIEASVSLNCSRCLEPNGTRLDIEFDSVYVAPAEEPKVDELALDAQQLDESVAEDGLVDLADVVREQILLALPEFPLCSEDCRGLCPKCGGNRNLIDCKCEENEIDPRWSKLRDIR